MFPVPPNNTQQNSMFPIPPRGFLDQAIGNSDIPNCIPTKAEENVRFSNLSDRSIQSYNGNKQHLQYLALMKQSYFFDKIKKDPSNVQKITQCILKDDSLSLEARNTLVLSFFSYIDLVKKDINTEHLSVKKQKLELDIVTMLSKSKKGFGSYIEEFDVNPSASIDNQSLFSLSVNRENTSGDINSTRNSLTFNTFNTYEMFDSFDTQNTLGACNNDIDDNSQAVNDSNSKGLSFYMNLSSSLIKFLEERSNKYSENFVFLLREKNILTRKEAQSFKDALDKNFKQARHQLTLEEQKIFSKCVIHVNQNPFLIIELIRNGGINSTIKDLPTSELILIKAQFNQIIKKYPNYHISDLMSRAGIQFPYIHSELDVITKIDEQTEITSIKKRRSNYFLKQLELVNLSQSSYSVICELINEENNLIKTEKLKLLDNMNQYLSILAIENDDSVLENIQKEKSLLEENIKNIVKKCQFFDQAILIDLMPNIVSDKIASGEAFGAISMKCISDLGSGNFGDVARFEHTNIDGKPTHYVMKVLNHKLEKGYYHQAGNAISKTQNRSDITMFDFVGSELLAFQVENKHIPLMTAAIFFNWHDGELKVITSLQTEVKSNDILYGVIMEELPNAKDVIKNYHNKDIPPSELQKIALDTAQAIETLHNKGIAHNDIKPANIVVSTNALFHSDENNQTTAQLVDYNIAKKYGHVADITKDKGFNGTHLYISPEKYAVCGKANKYGHIHNIGQKIETYNYKKNDIWAFGLTLLNILCKSNSYDGTQDDFDTPRVFADFLNRKYGDQLFSEFVKERVKQESDTLDYYIPVPLIEAILNPTEKSTQMLEVFDAIFQPEYDRPTVTYLLRNYDYFTSQTI